MKTKEVIFIPGIFCVRPQFNKIIEYLEKAHFKVHYFHMKDNETLEKNIELLKQFIKDNKIKKTNFVTHSFGSFFLRAFYPKRNCKISEIVEFGPMDHGSIVLEAVYKKFPIYTRIFGEKLVKDYLNKKEKVSKIHLPHTIGVIAGDKRFSPKRWESYIIPFLVNNKNSDGKVLIKETRFHAMHDFLKVHEYHSYIHENEKVIKQTIFYLKNGKFNKKDV